MENLVERNEEEIVRTHICGVPIRIARMIFKLAICILSSVDFWTDLLLGIQYANKGHQMYATFTFLFTLVPTACGALYVIRYLRRKNELTRVDKAIFVCCLFLQTHFVVPIWFLEDLYRKERKEDENEQKERKS